MISENDALIFAGMGFVLAVCSGLWIRQFIAVWNHAKFEYDYMKHPRLLEFSENRLCVEIHKWQETTLVLRGLPVGKYQVCTACGCISGNSEVMCSDAVLAQMRQALEIAQKKIELETQVQARINEVADGYIDAYIRRNFTSEVNDVHFAERLKKLAEYAFNAQASARDKVADEISAQTKLDASYKSWPSQFKGNA